MSVQIKDGVVQTKERRIKEECLGDFSKFIETVRCKYILEEEFVQLSNEERIKYCLEKESIRESIESYIKMTAVKPKAKASSEAKNNRLLGNKFFKLKNYEEALKCYSKALLQAPFPEDDGNIDEELSLAFANRSAVLFHLRQYKECLTNIDHAVTYHYPAKQLHTLYLRRAMCLKALARQDEADHALSEALRLVDGDVCSESRIGQGDDAHLNSHNDLKKFITNVFMSFQETADEKLLENYKLSFRVPKKSNTKLPSCNDFVRLQSSEDKGRYLTVTREVNRDEVLVTEKPFAAVLNSQFMNDFCFNCCQELDDRLFPCSTCCSVRFCSNECCEEASAFHTVECKHLKLLQSTGVLQLALRMLLKVGVKEASDMAKQVSKKAEIRKSYQPDYKSVLSLSSHSDKVPLVVSSRQTLAACFYLTVLSSQIGVVKEKDNDFYFIGALILKHIQQISVNSLVVFHQPFIPGPMGITGVDVKNQIIGTALYPTLSLINHSCIPSGDTFFSGSEVSVKAKFSIHSGAEVTLSYGPLYRKQPRIERLETLKAQYYFDCTCDACSMDKFIDSTNSGVVLADAIYCNECRGPFIVDSTTLGRCVSCGSTSIKLEETLSCINNGKRLLNIGKALIQFERVAEAEKHFQKSLAAFNKVCFPQNRLVLSVLMELLYALVLKEDFEGARKCCEECIKIKKTLFGEDSSEYMSSCLQLINIKWTQQRRGSKKSTSNTHTLNSMNKKLSQKLMAETLDGINSGEKLLRKHETTNGLVTLDSALVSFLKEMAELQKIKQLFMKF